MDFSTVAARMQESVPSWIQEAKETETDWQQKRFVVDWLRGLETLLEDPDLTGIDELVERSLEALLNEPDLHETCVTFEAFLRGTHDALITREDHQTVELAGLAAQHVREALDDFAAEEGTRWRDRRWIRHFSENLQQEILDHANNLSGVAKDYENIIADGGTETVLFAAAYAVAVVEQYGAMQDGPKDRASGFQGAPPAGVDIVEHPGVTFADVIGMQDVKVELAQAIRLIEDPQLANDHDVPAINGILLHGPPGTGKTYFAKAAAGEFNKRFLKVDAATLQDKYVGETEKHIKEIFDFARKNAPCILFFDEFDAVAPDRAKISGESTWMAGHVNQLLEQMDGLHREHGGSPIVVAATNFPERLDPAILRPGRIDVKVRVGLPGYEARLGLLRQYTRKRKLAQDVHLEDLARILEGHTPADIKGLVDGIKRAILKEGHEGAPRALTTQDFQAALTAAREMPGTS